MYACIYIIILYILYIYTYMVSDEGIERDSEILWSKNNKCLFSYIYIYIYMPYVFIVLNKLWEIYKGPIRSVVTGEGKRE